MLPPSKCLRHPPPPLPRPHPHLHPRRALLRHTTVPSRRFATVAPARERVQVHVPNGSIDVDIHYPEPSHSPCLIHSSRSALLFLPRGPLLNDPQHDALNVTTLRSTLACPVVHIHYRYGEQHKFPGPLFDVAAVYDWLVCNVLAATTPSRSSREPAAKIAVCGELLGGTLASTLALTECRPTEPAAVVAAAINDPVLNWVDFETTSEEVQVPRTALMSQLSTQGILEMRRLLFRNPADYFDPFASPILFFRAAGCRVPVTEPAAQDAMSEMDELVQAEQDHLLPPELRSEALSAVDSPALRKSSRRFPSKSLALRLPRFRLSTGIESELTAQATEFQRLLLKAFDRQIMMKSPRLRDTERTSSLISKQMVVQGEVNGLGLWDDSAEGRQRLHDMASWLADALND
ncbi:hypothetical protein CERZMDRAFT_103104 [Cercospora zeae-maydis SCOH1-5]|uniref:Alpha/beta hydrolase fold-3 domain-containing protein n=1 Tax=Cercospora zeae-maydis SCOH1-5 TaxID=717836 RepID=A0A6A6F0K0_9PEZI|nr:hypothetical protein CERZMDRAFT_103104 [Cercospora zeae-maydis SCOH1-5]